MDGCTFQVEAIRVDRDADRETVLHALEMNRELLYEPPSSLDVDKDGLRAQINVLLDRLFHM